MAIANGECDMNSLKYLQILLLSVVIATTSCSNENSGDAFKRYLPVKLVGADNWSIMDTQTGEILYRDVFKYMPSDVTNDMFILKNGSGTFDIYNVHDIKKPINKTSFYMIANFLGSNTTTPATLPGQPIILINNKGETVAELDKSIEVCKDFSEGLAAFMNDKYKWGFIDEKGEIAVEAKYDAVDYFRDSVALCTVYNATGENDIYAIDHNGKELFKFTSNDYTSWVGFNDGLMPVAKDNNIVYLDKTGKETFSLCSIPEKMSEKIGVTFWPFNDRFVFYDGGLFGLKDRNNNTIFRAKYETLIPDGAGEYRAWKGGKMGLIDYNDNVLIDFKYDIILPVSSGRYLAANKKVPCSIITEKGESINKENFALFSLYGVRTVKTNYIDADAYAQKMLNCFTDTSCAGFYKGITLNDVKISLTEDAEYYHDFTGFVFKDDLTRATWLFFDKKISRKTNKRDENNSDNNYVFNYDANLQTVRLVFDISESECLEEEITNKFETLLKAKGWKKTKDEYWKSPRGCFIGIEYVDGFIALLYFLNGDTLEEKLTKEPRKSKAKTTPKGMPDKDYVPDWLSPFTI